MHSWTTVVHSAGSYVVVLLDLIQVKLFSFEESPSEHYLLSVYSFKQSRSTHRNEIIIVRGAYLIVLIYIIKWFTRKRFHFIFVNISRLYSLL